MTLKTELISPERRLDEEVRQQNRKITSLPYLNDFLDAMPNMALVLNDRREVVFANRSFAAFLGYTDRNRLVGLRQGEAFGCIYSEVIGSRSAEETECARVRLTGGGCGTSEFCQNCGALISVLNSRENGRTDVQECRMVCGEQGVSETSLDLRVWSRPVEIEGEAFTIFSVIDIGDEKRRKALEKVFFHDVLNTASGVKGLADLLAQTGMSDLDMRDVASMISESTEQLIEEIHTQRMLADAESGDLTVSVQPIHSLELACWILRQFSSFSWGKNRRVLIDESAEHFEFFSDPTLVRRVLINLVKNAVEGFPRAAV